MGLRDDWGVIRGCRLSKYISFAYESIVNTDAPQYTNKSIKNAWACVYIHLTGDITYTTSRGQWVPEPLDIFTTDVNEALNINWGHKYPYKHYQMSFDKDLFDQIFGYNAMQHDITMDFLDHEQRPNLIRLPEPLKEELTDILDRIDPLLDQSNVPDVMISALSQIVRLFDLLYRANYIKPERQFVQTLSPLVEKAVHYVNRHFRELSGLADTAAGLYVVPEYLSRKFRGEMGVSFTDYLRDRKLDYSRLCLRLGHNVAEAAAEAGFSSASHFIQLYKNRYGTTPGKRNAGTDEH